MFPGLPASSFFLPGAYKDWRFERSFYAKAFNASTVVHLTHGNCVDGASCDALVRRAYGDGAVETIFLEPHETADALELMRRVPSRARALVISDLSMQRGQGERVAEALDLLENDGWRIMWRDHHHKQWEGIDLAPMRQAAEVTLDTTGTECGASLVQKALLPDDAWALELARLARDHDLWLREDPESMTLLHALIQSGADKWVRHLLMKQVVVDDTVRRWAARHQKRHDRLLRWGMRRTTVVTRGQVCIGIAYGRVPTNEVLHGLEEKGAHLSILLKPTGAFSLRSRKDVPVCHLIAQEFGGGGHPNASGGHLGLGSFSLMRLWARRTEHRAARLLVERAMREVEAHLQTSTPVATRRE